MKKGILSLVVFGLLFFNSCKEASTENTENSTNEKEVKTNYSGNYTVDTIFSIIDWIGSKPTGEHTGTIEIKEGNFEIINGQINDGLFIIDMTTINVTDIEVEDEKIKLENHLKGLGDKKSEDHFFNISKYPTCSFKINSCIQEGDKYMIKGILTIKEIANDVQFLAKISISEHEISIISDTFKIDRTKWGLDYASKSIFDNLKDQFIDDEIELTVKVKATN